MNPKFIFTTVLTRDRERKRDRRARMIETRRRERECRTKRRRTLISRTRRRKRRERKHYNIPSVRSDGFEQDEDIVVVLLLLDLYDNGGDSWRTRREDLEVKIDLVLRDRWGEARSGWFVCSGDQWFLDEKSTRNVITPEDSNVGPIDSMTSALRVLEQWRRRDGGDVGIGLVFFLLSCSGLFDLSIGCWVGSSVKGTPTLFFYEKVFFEANSFCVWYR